jgi:hypothetical protein
MPTTILLGNTAPVESVRIEDPETGDSVVERNDRSDLGNTITTVTLPDDPPMKLVEVLQAVQNLWPWHSDADGPEWVESDDSVLAGHIADHFTTDTHESVVGRPKGWKEG